MLRLKTLAFVVPLAAALAVPASVVAQGGSSLSQVSSHLREVDTMTASFSQTDRRGQVLNGTITLKRPGKVRFQYQKGVPLLIVGDGKAINVIDYQVRQVQRWPIGNSPLGILLDPAKDLSRIARVILDSSQGLVVQARDPKRPEYGTITLNFSKSGGAPAGLLLQGWTMLDSQNNRTTIRLSNQRFNAAVADNAFRWTDPRRSGPRG
jgi:outer membrane lipoprotein-sorting protein